MTRYWDFIIPPSLSNSGPWERHQEKTQNEDKSLCLLALSSQICWHSPQSKLWDRLLLKRQTILHYKRGPHLLTAANKSIKYWSTLELRVMLQSVSQKNRKGPLVMKLVRRNVVNVAQNGVLRALLHIAGYWLWPTGHRHYWMTFSPSRYSPTPPLCLWPKGTSVTQKGLAKITTLRSIENDLPRGKFDWLERGVHNYFLWRMEKPAAELATLLVNNTYLYFPDPGTVIPSHISFISCILSFAPPAVFFLFLGSRCYYYMMHLFPSFGAKPRRIDDRKGSKVLKSLKTSCFLNQSRSGGCRSFQHCSFHPVFICRYIKIFSAALEYFIFTL